MGIKQLNKFLKIKCREKLNKLHFSELYSKKVCVDTMIYIYKYLREGTLLESFYRLCLSFRKYNITPIFIFDGKIPQEKQFEIERRKELKETAFKNLQELNEKNKLSNEEEEMKKEYEKMIIKPNNNNIEDVKKLIELCGFQYIVADGEADSLCVELVFKKIVYACISEDMDMFVYGCPRVLRYFNIKHDTCVIYDLKDILTQLNISFEDFKWLCVLSGTDYHKFYNKKMNIFYYYRIFNKFTHTDSELSFYEWIQENKEKCIGEENYRQIYEMFKIKNNNKYKQAILKKGMLDINNIYELLEKELFLNPLK